MERATDGRESARTNMFLGASLQGEAFSSPVKIRNMSVSGALVEGATVPEPLSAVNLLRGSLRVGGIVAWAESGRCGLRFSSLVSVREWLLPPSNIEQQRVDEMVRLVKAGALPFAVQHPAPVPSGIARPDEVAKDLRQTCNLLEALGEDLVADMDVVARHGERLQNIDIAVQTINAVADVLTAGPDDPAARNRLDNLRASFAQALERPS